MHIVVDWHIPDKVLLMTCNEVVELDDLIKSLKKVAIAVNKSSAGRVYLIIDICEVRKIPGLIELLNIKVIKQSKFEDVIIVGMRNILLRPLITQIMHCADQQFYFVRHLKDAEKLIDSKEQFLYSFSLIGDDKKGTTELSACK